MRVFHEDYYKDGTVMRRLEYLQQIRETDDGIGSLEDLKKSRDGQ